MKTNFLIRLFIFFLFTLVVFSCKKDDEYTLEDKPVSGTFNYTQTGFVPLEVDPATQQPLKARISFEGTGTISDLGQLTTVSSFTFDFILGKGTDFVNTYTLAGSSDSFSGTGSSIMTENMKFTVTESFTSGTGKFEKIKGGGDTKIVLTPDGTSGTGTVTWTISY
jgi:hypothetical protein